MLGKYMSSGFGGDKQKAQNGYKNGQQYHNSSIQSRSIAYILLLWIFIVSILTPRVDGFTFSSAVHSQRLQKSASNQRVILHRFQKSTIAQRDTDASVFRSKVNSMSLWCIPQSREFGPEDIRIFERAAKSYGPRSRTGKSFTEKGKKLDLRDVFSGDTVVSVAVIEDEGYVVSTHVNDLYGYLPFKNVVHWNGTVSKRRLCVNESMTVRLHGVSKKNIPVFTTRPLKDNPYITALTTCIAEDIPIPAEVVRLDMGFVEVRMFDSIIGVLPSSLAAKQRTLENLHERLYVTVLSAEDSKLIVSEKYYFTQLYEINQLVYGRVISVESFGAFLALPNGGYGLLHLSQISLARIDNIESLLYPGKMIHAVVVDKDSRLGTISLSTKVLENYPGEIIANPDLFGKHAAQAYSNRNLSYLGAYDAGFDHSFAELKRLNRKPNIEGYEAVALKLWGEMARSKNINETRVGLAKSTVYAIESSKKILGTEMVEDVVLNYLITNLYERRKKKFVRHFAKLRKRKAARDKVREQYAKLMNGSASDEPVLAHVPKNLDELVKLRNVCEDSDLDETEGSSEAELLDEDDDLNTSDFESEAEDEVNSILAEYEKNGDSDFEEEMKNSTEKSINTTDSTTLQDSSDFDTITNSDNTTLPDSSDLDTDDVDISSFLQSSDEESGEESEDDTLDTFFKELDMFKKYSFKDIVTLGDSEVDTTNIFELFESMAKDSERKMESKAEVNAESRPPSTIAPVVTDNASKIGSLLQKITQKSNIDSNGAKEKLSENTDNDTPKDVAENTSAVETTDESHGESVSKDDSTNESTIANENVDKKLTAEEIIAQRQKGPVKMRQDHEADAIYFPDRIYRMR